MVLDEDTKREAGFSYLLMTARNEGAILPHPFSHYVEETSPDGTFQMEGASTSTTPE